METLKKIWDWLKTLPIWLRSVVLLLVSILALIFSVSCGQTVRVTVRDTPNGVSISTTQNKADSTSTNIHVSPTVHFYDSLK